MFLNIKPVGFHLWSIRHGLCPKDPRILKFWVNAPLLLYIVQFRQESEVSGEKWIKIKIMVVVIKIKSKNEALS